MKTDVVWRMKQRLALRRCFQLAQAEVPSRELTSGEYKRVAARFAGDMSRFRDEWTSHEYSSTPLVWREGRIAIRYRFIPPHRIVEVLSVGLECESQMKLSQPADPASAAGSSPAKQKTPHR